MAIVVNGTFSEMDLKRMRLTLGWNVESTGWAVYVRECLQEFLPGLTSAGRVRFTDALPDALASLSHRFRPAGDGAAAATALQDAGRGLRAALDAALAHEALHLPVGVQGGPSTSRSSRRPCALPHGEAADDGDVAIDTAARVYGQRTLLDALADDDPAIRERAHLALYIMVRVHDACRKAPKSLTDAAQAVHASTGIIKYPNIIAQEPLMGVMARLAHNAALATAAGDLNDLILHCGVTRDGKASIHNQRPQSHMTQDMLALEKDVRVAHKSAVENAALRARALVATLPPEQHSSLLVRAFSAGAAPPKTHVQRCGGSSDALAPEERDCAGARAGASQQQLQWLAPRFVEADPDDLRVSDLVAASMNATVGQKAAQRGRKALLGPGGIRARNITEGVVTGNSRRLRRPAPTEVEQAAAKLADACTNRASALALLRDLPVQNGRLLECPKGGPLGSATLQFERFQAQHHMRVWLDVALRRHPNARGCRWVLIPG